MCLTAKAWLKPKDDVSRQSKSTLKKKIIKMLQWPKVQTSTVC